MKLFLASAINNTLPLLKTLAPNIGNRVLFVANAADPYTDQPFVEWDRKAFVKSGYQLTEIDLRKVTSEELEEFLTKSDILHISGGSVYYLMALLREKGFDKVIKKAIAEKPIIYTGSSAGSVITAKSIKPFSYDEDETEHVKKMPDHDGLDLINFGIMPHCSNADFVEENKKVIEHMPHDLEPIFFIKDNQAIWVDGDCMKFLNT
jgi:peptidase E